MDPEVITLSKVRQTLYYTTYEWNLQNDANEIIYKIETDLQT